MKKEICSTITLVILAFLPLAGVFSQPANDTSDVPVAVENSNLPDTLVFNFDGQVVKIPTLTIQSAIQQGSEIVVEVKKKADENPPKNTWEWVLLVFSVLTTSGGLAFVTEIRKVASDLVKFFGKEMNPVNFVILISGAISAGISLLWNNGWNTVFFIGLWPTVFGIATFVYLKFIKKPKTDETATQLKKD